MNGSFEITKENRIHWSWDDGRLKQTSKKDDLYSTTDEVDRLFSELIPKSSKRAITIYFHGGLVPSKGYHTDIGKKCLFEKLSEDSYPIFIVWETGPDETGLAAAKDLWNDLFEILVKIQNSKTFTSLTKYIQKHISRKKISLEGGGMGLFEGGMDELPLDTIENNRALFADYEPENFDYSSVTWINDEEFSQDVIDLMEEIDQDEDLKKHLQLIAEKKLELDSMGGGLGLADTESDWPDELDYLSESVLDGIVEDTYKEDAAGVGLGPEIPWSNVAITAGKIFFAIIKRFNNKHHHDFHATLVEETLKALNLDHVGKHLWDTMKRNARETYEMDQDDEDYPHGGSYLLKKLNEFLSIPGNEDYQVNLVGHSAGSIQICHLIESAKKFISVENFKFKNVIFLAPACNFDTFQLITSNREWIEKFRIFTMEDDDEKQDVLVDKAPFVYPYSLLYLVSGVAEGDDNGDMPLVGLERHLAGVLFDNLPFIAYGRKFIGDYHIAWTGKKMIDRDGFRTTSKQHGDFDNNEPTIDSVQFMIKSSL